MSNNDFQSDSISKSGTTDMYNPWRKSIKNIKLGFAFTLMTFNFLGLQYILPTVGVVLLYIGLRGIHKENKVLKVAWIFSIINMVHYVFSLIYSNTQLSVIFNNSTIRIFILAAFQLIFLFIIRKGLKEVFKKGGIKSNRDPILGIIIWRVFVLICAITGLGNNWLVFIPIIIYYFYFLRSFNKLGDYPVHIIMKDSEATTRTNDKKVIWGYLGVCALILAISCLVSNHIKLDSQEFFPPSTSQSREKLIDLGFPVNILNDLSDEEVDLFKDVIYFKVSSEDLEYDSIEGIIKSNLNATTIYIELDNNKIYVIQYYEWEDGGSYWHDGFTITSTQSFDLIGGKLLYEKNGTNYSSPIPRLKSDMVTESDFLGNKNQYNSISGAVNYPFGSSEQRGYVLYRIDLEKEVWIVNSILNYLHYDHPFRFPYEETEKKNLWFNDNMKQHYTVFDTELYREYNDKEE